MTHNSNIVGAAVSDNTTAVPLLITYVATAVVVVANPCQVLQV